MKYESLPISQLANWVAVNDVTLTGAKIAPHIKASNGADKGAGLLASSDLASEYKVLSISRDLILCKTTISEIAKTDQHLQQVLEAVGEFGQNTRKAILIFLLTQLFYSSPQSAENRIGTRQPLTDYVKFLPKRIPLPTFYSSEECELLKGTSLAEALTQKLSSLEREFEHLRTCTEHIDWCQKFWWDEDNGCVNFDDWKLADAIYRSRALELPQLGDSMVPCIDMCNHASDDRCNARFEVDSEQGALLFIRKDKNVHVDEEVTIMYGVGGACEMVFSYGFLEDGMISAREMFLELRIPADDPLRLAKIHFAKAAPGVRIYVDNHGKLQWESDFVWWACINEEDGLDFQVLQSVDGEKVLQALWKGEVFQPSELKEKVFTDPAKEVFMLRAVVTILDRVEQQGEELSTSQESVHAVNAHEPGIRGSVLETIRRLRDLEMELLTTAYGALEVEKSRLINTDTVKEFLSRSSHGMPSDGLQEEDFS